MLQKIILDINKNEYFYLVLDFLITIIIFRIIKKLIIKLPFFSNDSKKKYNFTRFLITILMALELSILIFIFRDYLKNMITLISFISAAITIALREFILNIFSGIYIRFKKPFKIEDRIEINNYKGDIVNISLTSFELLEVSNLDLDGQSTGIIISIPNSTIFHHPIRNYTKAFKYIWDEIAIKVPLDCDLKLQKKELYNIVNNIETVKNIPKKMKEQIESVSAKYRIYYNKYDPIVYTKIEDDYIKLEVRYLVHPKKARFVKSVIWNKIIIAYKEKRLVLFK